MKMESEQSGSDDWRVPALDFSERMGRLAEHHGHPRMLGRVVGWLMVCEPPHQTTAQLARALKASVSAVHTIVRGLLDKGLVDRITFPGERSAYYRIPEDAATRMFRTGLPNVTAIRQLAEDGLKTFSWRSTEENQRLRELYEFHAFFEREMPRLLERWEEERQRRSREVPGSDEGRGNNSG